VAAELRPDGHVDGAVDQPRWVLDPHPARRVQAAWIDGVEFNVTLDTV